MKSILKKLFLFFVLLVAFTIWRYPYSDVVREKFQAFKGELARSGVVIDAKDLNATFPLGVRFTQLAGILHGGGVPIPFSIDSGSIDLSVPALIRTNGRLNFQLNAYDGSLSGMVEKAIRSDHQSGEVSLEKFNLAKHPTLEYYGISGNVSGKAQFAQSSPTERGNGVFELNLRDGAFLGGSRIGFPMVPPVDHIELNTNGKISPESIAFERLSLLSSLATGAGQGQCGFAPRRPGYFLETCQIALELQLKPPGLTVLGPYLALAAGMPLQADPGQPPQYPTNWKIMIAKQSNAPFTTVVRPN